MVLFRRLLLVALIAAVIVSCDQVDFTAPAGSILTITVQPPSVGPGGVSTITITGIRPNGAPLPDETSISFTTTIGSITPNPTKTKDGTAFAQFRAGTRSGTATVTATSGPNENVTTEIVIGDARPTQLLLLATPTVLPVGGGTVQLRAIVRDDDGNPLSGVGVVFGTSSGELGSDGRVIRTNSSGVAFDTLTTNVETTVTATTLNGTTNENEVVITIGSGGEIECGFVFSPSSPAPGEDVFFRSTAVSNSGAPIRRFLWDFGDGDEDEGQTVVHDFDETGTFTVVHTVIDAEGFQRVCTEEVTVELDAPICSFEVVPDIPQEGQNVLFDASASEDESGIATFEWSFGDGATDETTSPITNHIYSFPGCGGGGEQQVPVSLTVTDNEGQSSFCSLQITVECN